MERVVRVEGILCLVLLNLLALEQALDLMRLCIRVVEDQMQEALWDLEVLESS
jgi:hypothetical protein